MKFAAVALFAALSAVQALAVPAPMRLARREVPQEHSHDIIINQLRPILQLNANTLPDPIFSLLGNKAAGQAIADAGTIQDDPNCLQQNIADQTITNCKEENLGVECIALAVKFRALERNSGSVGQKSDLCTETPVNEELLTITQHQDPAAEDALQINGDIEIAVAKLLLSLGLSAEEAVNGALETATFGPGELGDPTARGLSCDDGAGGEFGDAIVADADGVDPITNFAFKAGDIIDCITDADVKDGISKRVPAKSREELLAALGEEANVVDIVNNNADVNLQEVADLLSQAVALLEKLVV